MSHINNSFIIWAIDTSTDIVPSTGTRTFEESYFVQRRTKVVPRPRTKTFLCRTLHR